ncbi:MAG TPA: oligosaccharide flippase family protein [Novosphingobium sp.]|nr:oligosaccharide flippase family protein [Novosphingobium sp.]
MSIGRNAAWNLGGQAIPALLALVTIPAYLHLLGAERYGVMALAWLLLGYFGVFDLGLGRAATQRISILRDADAPTRARALSSALAANLAIGLAGAMVLLPAAHFAFAQVFRIDPALRAEALSAVVWIALALPVATTGGVLGGALMARERFATANAISVTTTALFQLLPLGVAIWRGPELPGVLAAAVVARVLGLGLMWRAVRREFGPIEPWRWERAEVRALLAFGGWVALTSLVAPLLTLTDRFLVGAVVGAAAVAIYSVPVDLTQRLGAVAAALGNALFPRLALASGEEATRLVRAGIDALFVLLTPPVAAGLILADPLFRLWLGDAIGGQAAPLARVMLVAAWFNAFAQMAFVRLQAQGRPDLVAKLLLAETPVYLLALWWALASHGLWGAALVFLARMVIDSLGMAYLAGRRLERAWLLLPTLGLFVAACFVLRAMAPIALWPGLGWAALAAAGLSVAGWQLLPEDLRKRIPSLSTRHRI